MSGDLSVQIAELLLREGALLLRPSDPFRFASGILSPVYCDHRLLLSNVEGRRLIVEGLSERIASLGAAQVAGVATAGVPWGAWAAERLGKSFLYVRSASKDHGRKNQVEGRGEKGAPAALVEDLISTGGSILRAAAELREAGIPLCGAFGIFSYGFAEAKEAFARENLRLETLVHLDVLLETAQRLGNIGPKEARSILSWRNDPRGWETSRG